jgi:hypothetical protein
VVPSLSRQLADRLRRGCQPYVPAVLYLPGRFLVLISIRGSVKPGAIVRLNGLGELKKFNDLNGIQIRDIPVCSIAPQSTTLRVPCQNWINDTKYTRNTPNAIVYCNLYRCLRTMNDEKN